MKNFRTPFTTKKAFKQKYGKCHVCGETHYALLDVHRIISGEEGGRYENSNCVCICTSCHRKNHAGIIQIIGWFHSTTGRLLKYIDEHGKEQFK